MNQYDNWENLPPDVKKKLAEEKKTLAKIKLIYFKGNPLEIEPFSTSSISWKVTAVM